MHRGQRRIAHLDGLRGVAILLVLIFHLWGDVAGAYLPFKLTYGANPVVRLGWAGVELFFLISGYVILMTLERCDSFADFMRRRWLRLFPAMLIATGLLLAIDPIARRTGMPPAHLQDALAGLTFITPALWHVVLRIPITALDTVFWTLFAESTFYVVFGLMYFRLGWRGATIGLVLLNLFDLIAPTAAAAVHAPHVLQRLLEPLEWCGVPFFGWFASGACFARAREVDTPWLTVIAVMLGVLAVCTTRFAWPMLPEGRIATAAMLALFCAGEWSRSVQRLLSVRPLQFVGWLSYPLYLVHQKLGIALAWQWERWFPRTPWLLLPMAGIVPVMVVAWAMAKVGEPKLRALLDARLPRPSGRLPASAKSHS